MQEGQGAWLSIEYNTNELFHIPFLFFKDGPPNCIHKPAHIILRHTIITWLCKVVYSMPCDGVLPNRYSTLASEREERENK